MNTETQSSTRSLRPSGVRALLVVLAAGLSAMLTACDTTHLTSPDPASAMVQTVAMRTASAAGDAGSIRSQAQVFKGVRDITSAIGDFRTALGTLNPNAPGSLGSGRREINWDGVPAQFTNVDNFPADFFNQAVVGRARGVVFATPGSGFRVSDNNFADLNPTYAGQFEFFSPTRTFIAVGDNVTSVQFFVPGSNTPATSTGFGVVFSDIDTPGSGMLRLFDAAGHNLGTYLAPASPGGLSFLGVMYPEAIVARVEIVSGKAALGSASFDISNRDRGPARDLAIMDDFLYGEPIAIPAQTGIAAASDR